MKLFAIYETFEQSAAGRWFERCRICADMRIHTLTCVDVHNLETWEPTQMKHFLAPFSCIQHILGSSTDR